MSSTSVVFDDIVRVYESTSIVLNFIILVILIAVMVYIWLLLLTSVNDEVTDEGYNTYEQEVEG